MFFAKILQRNLCHNLVKIELHISNVATRHICKPNAPTDNRKTQTKTSDYCNHNVLSRVFNQLPEPNTLSTFRSKAHFCNNDMLNKPWEWFVGIFYQRHVCRCVYCSLYKYMLRFKENLIKHHFDLKQMSVIITSTYNFFRKMHKENFFAALHIS